MFIAPYFKEVWTLLEMYLLGTLHICGTAHPGVFIAALLVR